MVKLLDAMPIAPDVGPERASEPGDSRATDAAGVSGGRTIEVQATHFEDPDAVAGYVAVAADPEIVPCVAVHAKDSFEWAVAAEKPCIAPDTTVAELAVIVSVGPPIALAHMVRMS